MAPRTAQAGTGQIYETGVCRLGWGWATVGGLRLGGEDGAMIEAVAVATGGIRVIAEKVWALGFARGRKVVGAAAG